MGGAGGGGGGTFAVAPLSAWGACWVEGFGSGELGCGFEGLLHAANVRSANAVVTIAICFMVVCFGFVLCYGVKTPNTVLSRVAGGVPSV